MKKPRTMQINGKNWKFIIGGCHIAIWSPTGVKILTNHSEVTGRDWNTLERGQWKKTNDGMVCPGHVRGWILKNHPELC